MDSSIDFVRRIVPATEAYFMVPAGAAFNPTSLFVGDTGGWWNPADHTTTWQDSARTTPADTAGQPVGAIDDKSGNGNNLLQATGGNRPILRNSGALWWLEFDGITQTIGNTFTEVQPYSRISAVKLVTWVIARYLFDGGTINKGILATFNASPSIGMGLGVDPTDVTHMTPGGSPNVITELWNTVSSKLAVDNNAYNNAGVGPGSDDPGGLTIGGGGSGGQNLQINYYGSISIGRILSTPEIASCRTFFGALAGISL